MRAAPNTLSKTAPEAVVSYGYSQKTLPGKIDIAGLTPKQRRTRYAERCYQRRRHVSSESR